MAGTTNAKMRTALMVVQSEAASGLTHAVTVRERKTNVRLVVTADGIERCLDLHPDQARAVAKHLNTIARRVETRPEGVL